MMKYKYEQGFNPKEKNLHYARDIYALSTDFTRLSAIYARLQEIYKSGMYPTLSEMTIESILALIKRLADGDYTFVVEHFVLLLKAEKGQEHYALLKLIYESACKGAVFEPEKLKD